MQRPYVPPPAQAGRKWYCVLRRSTDSAVGANTLAPGEMTDNPGFPDNLYAVV